MTGKLGTILRRKRGNASRLSFARKLQLSYTFVRALEEGIRLPSDEVLMEIAEALDLDFRQLILAAYCDRSPTLEETLRGCGVEIPNPKPFDGLPMPTALPPVPQERGTSADSDKAAG